MFEAPSAILLHTRHLVDAAYGEAEYVRVINLPGRVYANVAQEAEDAEGLQREENGVKG